MTFYYAVNYSWETVTGQMRYDTVVFPADSREDAVCKLRYLVTDYVWHSRRVVDAHEASPLEVMIAKFTGHYVESVLCTIS